MSDAGMSPVFPHSERGHICRYTQHGEATLASDEFTGASSSLRSASRWGFGVFYCKTVLRSARQV